MNHIENLDNFLSYISKKEKYTYSQEIFKELKEKYSVKDLTLTIEKLYFDNYIDKKNDESINVNKIEPPYYCRINYHGLLFLEEGGYKSKNKRNKIAIYIAKAKIVLITINAIVILLIAAAGVYVSYDSKKKDETINKNNLLIDSLKNKINKLENINKK